MCLEVSVNLGNQYCFSKVTSRIPFIIRFQPLVEIQHRPHYSPVAVALVIDRSGSMGGLKLELAKVAAIHVVHMLDDNDVISVYAFDDKIKEIVGPTIVYGKKEKIVSRIHKIKVGGATDIYSALRRARISMAQFAQSYVTRIILLTDGMPTYGVTDHDQIVGESERAYGQGISVIALGIGKKYDECLLSRMADASNGYFEHISDVRTLPQIFEYYVRESTNVIARNTIVEILPADNVKVEILGRSSSLTEKGSITVDIGDVYASSIMNLYGYIILPPKDLGKAKVMQVHVRFYDMTTKSQREILNDVSVEYTPDTEKVKESINQDINSEVLAVKYGEEIRNAVMRGDFVQATRMAEILKEVQKTVVNPYLSQEVKRTLMALEQGDHKTLVALTGKLLKGKTLVVKED